MNDESIRRCRRNQFFIASTIFPGKVVEGGSVRTFNITVLPGNGIRGEYAMTDRGFPALPWSREDCKCSIDDSGATFMTWSHIIEL